MAMVPVFSGLLLLAGCVLEAHGGPTASPSARHVDKAGSSAAAVDVHDVFLNETEVEGMQAASRWLLRRTIATENRYFKRAVEMNPHNFVERGKLTREHPMIGLVQERVNQLVGLPGGDSDWQVFFVRQDKGWDKLAPFHHDLSGDPERWVTVLIYLATVPAEAGGQTLFPCFSGSSDSTGFDPGGLCDTLRAGFEERGERNLHIPEFAGRRRGLGLNQGYERGVQYDSAWNETACDLIAQQCDAPTALAVQPLAGRALVWESAVRSTRVPLSAMWHGSCTLRKPPDGAQPSRSVVQFFKKLPARQDAREL